MTKKEIDKIYNNKIMEAKKEISDKILLDAGFERSDNTYRDEWYDKILHFEITTLIGLFGKVEFKCSAFILTLYSDSFNLILNPRLENTYHLTLTENGLDKDMKYQIEKIYTSKKLINAIIANKDLIFNKIKEIKKMEF
jgi:hypothetical protein